MNNENKSGWTTLDWALYYCSLGFSVIPVCTPTDTEHYHGDRKCEKPGKVPVIKWTVYKTELASQEQIREWFGEQFPTANVGLVMGEVSGRILIDFDMSEEEMLKNEIYKQLPKTVMAKTGRGFHLFFKYPGKLIKNSTEKLGDKIDVKGDLGFAIVEPSLHKDGNQYEWITGPDEIDFAELPQSVLEKITEKPNAINRQSDNLVEDDKWAILSGVEEGRRNDSALRISGKYLQRFPENEQETIAWRSLKNWSNKCDPPLSEEELRGVFESAIKMSERNEIPNPEGLKEITPAQCFIDGKAMIAVSFPEIIKTDNGPRCVQVCYLITSDHEKIPLQHSELLLRGYYYERFPSQQSRWSLVKVNQFLSGGDVDVDVADIFIEIESTYARYVDFGNQNWNKFMACWVIGTYFHRIFDAFPYIHLYGNMDSGKSKATLLSMLLAFNGEMTVNSTPSFVIRVIHDNNSSCGVDEAEKLGADEENQLLVAMFNNGYKKGSFSGKSEPSNKSWIPKRFDPYSPKIFNGIKNLAPTLTSRCVTMVMVRTQNKEIKNREVKVSDPLFQTIRDKLYSLVMTRHSKIQEIYNSLTDEQILGREWELWKPILSIVKLISDDLYTELRTFALEIQEQKKQMVAESTNTPKLLKAILQYIEFNLEDDDFYTVNDLVKNCILSPLHNPASEDFKWLETAKQPGRWLGDELRKSGVVQGQAQQKKVEGKNQRGYNLNKKTVEDKLKAYQEL